MTNLCLMYGPRTLKKKQKKKPTNIFEKHLKIALKANNNFLTDFSLTSITELECLNTSIRTEGNPSSPKKLLPFSSCST